MVALKTERRVFLWRVRPRVTPADAADAGKVATLDEIVGILEGALSAGRARVFLATTGRILDDDDEGRDDKNQLYIAKIVRHPASAGISLLVNRGDPEAVAPAFLNASDNSVRVEHPKRNETSGWSAHLVVSATAVNGMHRACFEQMPRVSSTIVLAAFEKIIARELATNPTYRYDTIVTDKGKKKVVWRAYRPSLDAARVPSENLIDDLEVGSLSTITLTKASIFYSGIGVADRIRRQEEKVVIKLKPVDDAGGIKELVAGIMQKAKSEHYESVTFNVDDLPGRQTSSPTIPIDDHDAMEHLYVRAKRLTDFATILEQCYSEPCSEIEDRMLAIVNDSDEWTSGGK